MKRFTFSVVFLLATALLMACGHGKSTNTEPVTTDTSAIAETTQNSPQQPKDDYHGIKPASVDTMQMVVDNHGNLVGRYVQTNQTTYTVSVQDEIEVPRLGHKIVEYKAKNGQGVVFTRRKNVNVRSQPNLQSPVICQITCKEGELPDTYPCLGKTQGWYKIKVRNTEGYVRHDLVEWDGMSTF